MLMNGVSLFSYSNMWYNAKLMKKKRNIMGVGKNENQDTQKNVGHEIWAKNVCYIFAWRTIAISID